MSVHRRAAAAVVAALLASIAIGAPVQGQDLPVEVTGPDPALAEQLDAIVGQAPPDTCLRVSVDGVAVYDHRGSDLQTPASTQKLFTASTALDRLGADQTLLTELVATAVPVGGVIAGDLILVGGGDPVLTTSIYRMFRKQPEAQPTTSLDALVDQLAGAGVTEVRGRVLVDDGRYDALRTVPSWPTRYLDQDQVGPLGALVIDDGFQLQVTPSGLQRVRAADPGLAAADAFAALLAARGITVATAGTARTVRPAAAAVLGSVESPPVSTLVRDLLQRSDNQMAELLLKEVGLRVAGAGTTEAGARAVADWSSEAGAAASGSVVVDGSGLDPTNATSCQGLVSVLDVGGPDGAVAQGLPVAGESGTLARRFGGTDAIGHLRAKTGSLRDVSALAGFVDLAEGGTATFAFVANGEIGDQTRRAEDQLAQVLASWRPPCPEQPATTLLAPLAIPSLVVVAVPGAGLASAGPGLAVAADALAASATAPLDRCSIEAGSTVSLGMG